MLLAKRALPAMYIAGATGGSATFYVAETGDKWWDGSETRFETGTPLLEAYGDSTSTVDYGYVEIDTSAIPDGATITLARLDYYLDSEGVAGKGVSHGYYIYITDGSFWTFYSILQGPAIAAGAYSATLDANAIAKISKTGNSVFNFRVINSGLLSGESRWAKFRAYEYGTPPYSLRCSLYVEWTV